MPSVASAQLQREILKGEWRFPGFVVSDWGAIRETLPHGFAADLRHAAQLSILSGTRLLRETEHEKSILHAMVEAGAVDGCTRERVLSVDGINWDDYAQTVSDISVEVSRFLENTN